MPQTVDETLFAELNISGPIQPLMESPVKSTVPKAPHSTPMHDKTTADEASSASSSEASSSFAALGEPSSSSSSSAQNLYTISPRALFFGQASVVEETSVLQLALNSRELRYRLAAQKIDLIIDNATKRHEQKIKELTERLSRLDMPAAADFAQYTAYLVSLEKTVDHLLDELSDIEGDNTGNVSLQNEFYFNCDNELKQTVASFLREFYQTESNRKAIEENRLEKISNTGSDSAPCLSFFMVQCDDGCTTEDICFVAVSTISRSSKGSALWRCLDDFVERYNKQQTSQFFLTDGATNEVHQLIFEVSTSDSLTYTRNLIAKLRDTKNKFEELAQKLNGMSELSSDTRVNGDQYAKRLERITTRIGNLKINLNHLEQNSEPSAVNMTQYQKTCAEKPLFISLLKFITQKRASGYTGDIRVTGGVNFSFDNQLKTSEQVHLEKNTSFLIIDGERGLKTIPCCSACIQNKPSVMAALSAVMEKPLSFFDSPEMSPKNRSTSSLSSTFSPLKI